MGEVKSIVDGMGDGEALLLENTRFYKEETKNDAAFVEKLAAPFDLFVNDAFGTAHRAHASTEGVTKYLSPSVSGYLLAKELEYLAGAVDEPVRPLAAIVGGSKVSSKITVLESLIKKCDKDIVGGGMTFTFLKARGKNVGTSLVEDDFIQTAKDAMKLAEEKGCELIFPNEILVADAFDANANTQVVSSDAIPDGWMGLDNGPAATKMIQDKLADCKTVIWNGPMGVFEMDAFAKGTFAICDTLKELTEKAPSPSSAAATPSPPSRRRASPTPCRTSPRAAARRSSSSRARSSRASPRSTRPKRASQPRCVEPDALGAALTISL